AVLPPRWRLTGLRRRYMPRLLESIVYALTLGSLIVFVMYRVFGLRPLAIGDASDPTAKIVMAFGAGVHEEIVFRLGALAGGAAILRVLGLRHTVAVVLAFIVSSAVFSAAHHIGPMGEPFTVDAFVYRTIAGGIFGAIFYFRSLAHAVYTHALYDVYVMLLR